MVVCRLQILTCTNQRGGDGLDVYFCKACFFEKCNEIFRQSRYLLNLKVIVYTNNYLNNVDGGCKYIRMLFFGLHRHPPIGNKFQHTLYDEGNVGQ